MKCRVIYRTDGGVSVARIGKDNAEFDAMIESHYQEHLKHPLYVKATYEDIDESQLPIRDSATRDKWRKSPSGGVMIDNTVVLSREVRDADMTALKAENAKPSPNSKVVSGLIIKLMENKY